METRGVWRWMGLMALACAMLAAGCDDDDGVGPDFSGVETAVVVNSIDLSITVFPVDTPTSRRATGLGQAGSPVSGAAREGLVVVPMGLLASASVVDLARDSVWSIPLPAGSGATGVDFLNDSIVYVANPNLNTVSRLNARRGTAHEEIAVGTFPQAVAVARGRVFVANGELDQTFRPAGPGTVSVIDPGSNSVVGTIILMGLNPSAMALGPDGLLYVVSSGAFGQGNGSLSVVDPTSLQELEHHDGFGEFPGDIAIDDAGLAYISSFAFGIAVWDAVGDSFISPPADPLVLDGNTISSGVGLDSAGRLYSLIPGDCVAPGELVRTGPAAEAASTETIPVGVCPIAIAFTRVESP